MASPIWLAGARLDYAKAYSWYIDQSLNAAEGFESEIESGLDAIVAMPELWPPFDERHRFYVLNRYPYSIIYRSLPERLLIVAIAHSSRDPSYWLER